MMNQTILPLAFLIPLAITGMNYLPHSEPPALLTENVWADIPGGATNGNVEYMEDACFMKEGTPIARTKSGVQVYAPGHTTYGSECPPGIPIPDKTIP